MMLVSKLGILACIIIWFRCYKQKQKNEKDFNNINSKNLVTLNKDKKYNIKN